MKKTLQEIICIVFVVLIGIVNALGQIPYPTEPPNMPDSETNGKNVFFLHGFNVSEQEARGWASKMFKSLYQSGMRAKFHPVTWQGDEHIVNPAMSYHRNVVNAFETAQTLAQTVNAISGEKIIIAHSLGNMVVSAAIQDYGMVVDKYFALNSAVPVEAYDPNGYSMELSLIHEAWDGYLTRTWASEWHNLFPSSNWRSQLTWRGRFKDVAQRTEMYNYYSSGDEVLEIFNGTPDEFTGIDRNDKTTYGRYAWHKQEILKGNGGPVGTVWAGWGFYSIPDLVMGVTHIVYTSSEANALTPHQLIRSPVFRHAPRELFRRTPPANITTDAFLAHGIPVVSRPAGVIAIPYLEPHRNVDMNTAFARPNGWPRNESTSVFGERWLHSDIKDVAYPYTYPVFKYLVQQGGLK